MSSAVNMQLTDSGSTKWDQLAQQQFHNQVAMTLDSIVRSAPTIQPNDAAFTSFHGALLISGRFTQTEAKDLAKLINYGALPSLFTVKKVRLRNPAVLAFHESVRGWNSGGKRACSGNRYQERAFERDNLAASESA